MVYRVRMHGLNSLDNLRHEHTYCICISGHFGRFGYRILFHDARRRGRRTQVQPHDAGAGFQGWYLHRLVPVHFAVLENGLAATHRHSFDPILNGIRPFKEKGRNRGPFS